jgi:NADH-quinone oxidoreductase subunit L
MAVVFGASIAMIAATARGAHFDGSVTWLRIGERAIEVGVRVDPLSATMVLIVSFVSLFVQLYSIGYMESEERFRWFFGAISLFTAAMLGVVLADGWLLMYLCWEIMGLASYLLIGFWYEKEAAPPAAMKAFMVTRAGDVGFALALALIWANVGSFTFDVAFEVVETGAWAGPSLIAAALLLFCGAMGKSAQFPLHVWLPDAMAGPTPGSALIHAATMVAAGVYLVARSFPLFAANPVTLTVVGVIGTITAVMGALIALAQTDIKKVLAFSTISQLGYMFLALGTGNWIAAIFHLMTHAFFKAVLFLGAGSVIHAMHTQEMSHFGGLWKKMPWTTATWCIGALSLAGIPPLAGFWSKDEILLSALHSHQYGILAAGLVTAGLTAFYMARTTFLTFFVPPGPASLSERAHESPWVMTVPLVVLSALAVGVGFVGSPVTGYAFVAFLHGHEAAQPDLILAAVAVGIAAGGIVLAWSSYLKGLFAPDGYFRFRLVSGAMARGFHIDAIYELVLVKPTMFLADLLRALDTHVIDGLVRGAGYAGSFGSRILAVFDRRGIDGLVDGLGEGVVGSGDASRRIQTGNVQTYLMLFAAGILLAVVVFAR